MLKGRYGAMKKLAEAKPGEVVMVISDSSDCIKSLAISIVRLGLGTINLVKERGAYRLEIVKALRSASPSDRSC